MYPLYFVLFVEGDNTVLTSRNLSILNAPKYPTVVPTARIAYL